MWEQSSSKMIQKIQTITPIPFRFVFQLKNSNNLRLTVRFNDAIQFKVKLSTYFLFNDKTNYFTKSKSNTYVNWLEQTYT